MKLSIAVTVNDEEQYVYNLLQHLIQWAQSPPMGVEAEIVVAYDKGTPEILTYLRSYEMAFGHKFRVYQHSLNRNFAEHKNFLNSKCEGHWILQLDADEWVEGSLLDFFPLVIDANPLVEAYWIPRLNFIRGGLTSRHLARWGWTVQFSDDRTDNMPDTFAKDNPEAFKLLQDYDAIVQINETESSITYKIPYVCWPDPQMRLYKNAPHIKWTRPVHEQLTGYQNYSNLPFDPQYAIIHDKHIDRQEQQNALYETLQ